jgi:AcrR family transcriptional regulator
MAIELVGYNCDDKRGLRGRQREARDEAILESAFSLIAEDGYEALTMEALAARVGISRQTLYHHFASREDIMLRAVLTLMDQGIQAIESFDPTLPAIERLKLIVRWKLEQRFEPACAALVKDRSSIISVKSHPEYLRAFERRSVVLADIVREAQTSGDIRNDLSPRLVIQMMLGLISDASYENLVATGETERTKLADIIIDVFFSGLRA